MGIGLVKVCYTPFFGQKKKTALNFFGVGMFGVFGKEFKGKPSQLGNHDSDMSKKKV